ncbi:carbohydrate-binding protein [Algibacter sp. L3A6]|uniref:carbohydrate-binding protein n=1 Tax=Algibacter sp. L3A6 TaxID=2686366 RepID=UPI00131C14E0|nr:carbohydrate-binding protein [Algibacter sp. L3A6]
MRTHFSLFSKLKSFVLLITLFFVFQDVDAQVVGPGDWSSLRMYGHAFNVNGFSATEYDWIENHNFIFTVEKRHANILYPNPSSEFASGVASDQINANNPDSKVLFYWNASKPHQTIYEESEDILVVHPEWLFTDTTGQDRWTWNEDAFVTWWSDVGIDQMNNTSHEGVFIDLVATVNSQRGDNGLTKLETALARMRDNSDGIVIHSAFWPSGDGEFLAGSRTVEHSDGVFVESFFHHICDTELDGKAMLDALLAVPSDKYIITTSKPDGVWGTDHQFAMAAHLIIANNQSFHRHFYNGYSSADLQIWHDDFGKYIGEPNGPATVNGSVYTRTFANAFVTVNVSDRTSSIVWGPTSTNLALNGTASQSSTILNAEASRSIDNNTNGAFSGGSVTHTDGTETSPWWQVNLGAEYSIGDINVFGRTGCCMDRLNDFTVLVYDATGARVFHKTFSSYPDPSVTVNAGNIMGKTIRVRLNGTAALSLAEVEVFEGGVNCATFTKIESENYDSMLGINTRNSTDVNGGLDVIGIDPGDWCMYSNIDLTCATSVSARVATARSGDIEVRLGGVTGTLIGTIPVVSTGGWQNWTTVSANLTSVSGVHDVYLVFTGSTTSLMNLTWFEFNSLTSANKSISNLDKDLSNSVSDLDTDTNLLIYPNPASDIINVEFSGSEAAVLDIINHVGQTVLSVNINEGSASYDISNLPSGLYIVRISNENETYLRKIIKM